MIIKMYYEKWYQRNKIEDTLYTTCIRDNGKFLVLPPLEADEKLEALKHYYGITHTNELIVRGIEARRHDAPNFIKDFQSELIYTLFDCKNSDEILSKGYENESS